MNNSKVNVAVRVRPLNQREEGLNSECIVRVSGNQITLLPPISCKEKARKEPHTFIYDNCFWTEDRHETGQKDVFEHLGDGALENIWLGFNVCIFAYGQTGSGKTFSMMGTDDQPGIVPRICSALFNKESNDLDTIRIEASYFEIYNEEVRDLLRSAKDQKKLRVREDRLIGPYVEELSCHAVQSYEEIKLLLDQGNKQRAIAETKMNEQSSRSHSILSLTVTQTCNGGKSGASRELVSKVSLVDLAGSERSYKSGAQGRQLKESCNINKSLLTLGLVINSLAEISENKRKSQFVNYRDSVLTWLLKNNLGGNSKTIMLATVSPAADNYQETLSTLRYADSAKRIVNQAVVNEDVKSKAIEELQEEIKRLREQLTTTEQVKAEVQELKSQLEEKENLLGDLKTSWEEKLKRTEVATQEWKKSLEHMGLILKKQNVTFSNDCYLMQRGTSLVIHNINDIIKIGSGPSQGIQISGPEAECEHCVIQKTEEGEVLLIAVNNSKTYVNGCLSKTKTQLWHEDKIQIGINVFELQQPSRPKPEYMKANVSSEAEVQTYDGLNTENGRSPIFSERDGWNSNMIENEKSKTKSEYYKATESSTPTIPASDDDLNFSENKQTSDMFTQISNEPNRQPIDMELNTTRSEYLEIGEGTEDIMVPCSPQYGEASSQTSGILGNSNDLQSIQDLEDRANLPRISEISREKKQLQRTLRGDMSPTSPSDEMEEYNIPTCDIITDDFGVTSQQNTCKENQNEENPHQKSNTDTYNISSHVSVLHQECDCSSEESKAKPDLNISSKKKRKRKRKKKNTSSKIELLQNEKGLCDNDGDGDTDMASDGLQKTRRQDTSHPSPHVEIEKPNISPSDKIPDVSQVTSQHETCEENQHEKTEEVPPQQSNSDPNIASPHENVLHQECEFSSEKPKAEPDLNTSSKTEMQNDKGLCDIDREGDKEVASDGLQRTCRQDMSHPSLDDKMEESNIPPGDKLPDGTSQHHTCEENQDEKTEEVPHQQSNTDTNKASPHGSVLHQESDDSSEKPTVEPDLNTSLKKELPQNDKGHCDLDGENDTEMSSDDDFVDCHEFILDEEHTSCESSIQLQNPAKDLTDHKEPDIDPNTLSSETSIPSVFSEESTKEIQNEKENMFKELLEKMKIDTKQTSKLTLQKVLEIGPESLMTDEPSDDDNALWYFVRRLMSLNGDARNINKLFIKSEESGGNKDDSLIFCDESDSQDFIHPLDVVSAAFHCSDHFLQQEIISKMSMCQFAVPLLLPDADGPECTFMLWAMRGIVKKWRPQSLADSKGFKEDSLVNVPMPTISFVRLGNCRLSKSKILNQLLGPTQHQHEHFIHRDMEGGNTARKISDGLVEISWYFPGGKGKFPEPVAFTNLRGSLESNMKQFNFLTEISSVIVILTDGISKDQYDLLMKYNSHNTKFLLIISPEDTRMKEDTQERLKLLAPVLNLTQDSVSMIPRNTNETTASSKLHLSLLSLIQNNIKTLSLETISKQASRHGIRIDEDFEECQKAKLAAKEITDEIKDVEKYKKETMKLQAGPLKEMAKFEKEMCQMKGQGNSNGEKYKSNLRKKCDLIRQNQWECNIPTGISKFVNALTSKNTSEKFYFLQWLKFYLDVEARKCLYPLQAQYKKTCNLPEKQKELAKLDQKISDSSLGIEHFLREVGQFYEAWHCMGKKGKSTTINFESLPKIAADLLLDGFPLELIDGDASRIPLQWIKDVLTELDKKVEGKSRLRVITVLGVQSTGKSTLLNTMFGLQFPVASGRCTRGAFMTLLRVKEHFQSYFMCQFILVIDTEGLKAPELDSLEGSYEHDNELATLVIGLSDITLINMAMENTTEMKDILQIVIHAFLRMKEIGKKPNCQFVHQNVSDVSAPSMNMRGRKKMMDQLDEMTRTVAVMEKKTQFSCFSDIMEYDLEHNNCYIAGLWHGVPPMASVSSAYSENVNELKQKLLKIMKDRHKTQNIIEFILWVSDIWSAVKHENFIFSFRNSLIAKAYNQLSIKYSEREWKFNKLMHDWFTNSETLIKNQSAETLEAKANKCKKDAECILTREGKEILAWLEEYFSKETDCGQLIKYKTDFVISAQSLIKSLETSSITKLNKTIQTQKDNISVQDVYRQQIKRIEQQVSNFIDECRQRKHEPSNAELEEELEKIWNNAAKNLKVSNRKVRDIEGEMLLVLTKDMKERGSGVNEKIQKTTHFPEPKKQQNTSFIQKCTNIYHKLKGNFQYEDFFKNVLHKCINYSEKQTQKGSDYDDTYCRHILNIIDENCKHADAKNFFSADRELDLKLAILGHVLVDFQKMHLTFLEKNDPHARLNSLKPLYFETFKNCFQKKNESKSLAERVCKNLFKPSLTDHINRKLGIKVVDDIANSKDSEKYTSRMFFQFTVLESLLEEDNFQNYVNYSSDYKNFVKSWITNYIVKEYTNISTLQVSILSDIMGQVKSSLKNPPALNLKDVSEFLSHLCENLNSDLVLPQQTMEAIIFENSATIEDFIDYMKKSLDDTEEEIRTELKSLSTKDILSRLVVKPQDELFKKVFGCGKQCPFCKVPCEAGGTDHKEHFASVHRPEGLGRYRWETTEVLCHDICTTLVVGNALFNNELTDEKFHPYKDYRDFYPDWKIQPDDSIEASDYWKFILKEYNKKFAEEYNAKPANYPEEWNSLTREMAKERLQKTFNM